MALIAVDFIAPTGRLDTSWASDLSVSLAAWISDAEDRTTVEAGQRAWVYYRAYSAIVDGLMMRPAHQASGDGDSITRTPAQLAHWKRLQASALDDYRAAVGAIAPAGGVTVTTPTW